MIRMDYAAYSKKRQELLTADYLLSKSDWDWLEATKEFEAETKALCLERGYHLRSDNEDGHTWDCVTCGFKGDSNDE
jgi:hypothetical protein